jgi:beta-galactosidase
MPKSPEPSRREFLSSSGKLVVGEALLTLAMPPADGLSREGVNGSSTTVQKSQLAVSDFFFGADVYPELQTRSEWNAMLDHFQRAHMNAVRVSESSWGNLETASGKYNFGWLSNFLDDLDRRKMKAILGTGSYIPPQWLAAGNPEILVQFHPGVKVHPMARHAPCLNHPLYRSALRDYILAIGKAFHQHPAVVAWQLGNEQEGAVTRLCFKPGENGCRRLIARRKSSIVALTW